MAVSCNVECGLYTVDASYFHYMSKIHNAIKNSLAKYNSAYALFFSGLHIIFFSGVEDEYTEKSTHKSHYIVWFSLFVWFFDYILASRLADWVHYPLWNGHINICVCLYWMTIENNGRERIVVVLLTGCTVIPSTKTNRNEVKPNSQKKLCTAHSMYSTDTANRMQMQ